MLRGGTGTRVQPGFWTAASWWFKALSQKFPEFSLPHSPWWGGWPFNSGRWISSGLWLLGTGAHSRRWAASVSEQSFIYIYSCSPELTSSPTQDHPVVGKQAPTDSTLRWVAQLFHYISQWNNGRNQVHNKWNMIELSPKHPFFPSIVCGETVFHATGPWCQKVGDCCFNSPPLTSPPPLSPLFTPVPLTSLLILKHTTGPLHWLLPCLEGPF